MAENEKNYKWIILVVIVLCGFNNVYFQYQMSPIADKIMMQYGLTQVQFSSLFTAPMAPAVFISLICGIIVDKFGAKRAIFIALIVAAFGIWGRMFTTKYSLLYFFMFIPGFACTFINANVAKILGEWFDAKMTGICVGIYLASSAVGQGIATSTTARLPSVKTAYMIAAIYATFIVFVWMFLYRSNHKRKEIKLSDTEGAEESVLTKLKAVIRNRNVIVTALCIMFAFGSLMSLTTFMPLILQSKGMTSINAGSIAAFISFGQLAGSLTGPAIASKINNIRKSIIIFSLSGVMAIVLIAFLPASILLSLVLFICGAAIGSIMPNLMSLPIKLKAIGVEKAGTAGGTLSTFQLLGAVLFPSYIVSPLSGGNWTKHLLIGAAICGLVGVCSLFLTKEVGGQNS